MKGGERTNMRLKLVLVALAQFVLVLPAAGQPPQGASGDTRQELVVSSGFVESKRISSGDPFPIWITFVNRSNGEIRNLRFVDFRIAGLKRAEQDPCWKQIQPTDPERRFPSCLLDSKDPATPSDLPAQLPPGQAITVTANLQRGSRSGEFMVTGVYTWLGTDNRVHRALVPIGPVEVTKNWENWRARMNEDFPLILKDIVFPALKDLGWPLAAFFLGLFIRFGEERRAAIQQAWHQMLPEIHKDTKKYYLPIQSAASGLIRSLAKPQDPDQSFYFFAILFRRMRVTLIENGGFYLKDRLGEDIAMGSWDRIFREFVGSFHSEGVMKKELLIDTIGEKETFSEYKKKLSTASSYAFPFPSRAALIGVKDEFHTWITTADFQELVLPLLQIFVSTIEYEINRPYSSWYTELPLFENSKFKKLENELEDWRESRGANTHAAREKLDDVKDFAKILRRYRRRNTPRLLGTRWLFRLGRFLTSRKS